MADFWIGPRKDSGMISGPEITRAILGGRGEWSFSGSAGETEGSGFG